MTAEHPEGQPTCDECGRGVAPLAPECPWCGERLEDARA